MCAWGERDYNRLARKKNRVARIYLTPVHMYSLNKVQLIGNLTRDPEMRQLQTGVSVASFSVATNQVWNDQNGVRQEKAEFHDVVAWRKLADIAAQILRKGGKVYIEGKMQTREWTGEDGVKRRKTEIVAENIIALDKKSTDFERSAVGIGSGASQAQAGGSQTSSVDSGDPLQDKEEVAVGAGGGERTAEPSVEDVTIDDLPF